MIGRLKSKDGCLQQWMGQSSVACEEPRQLSLDLIASSYREYQRKENKMKTKKNIKETSK